MITQQMENRLPIATASPSFWGSKPLVCSSDARYMFTVCLYVLEKDGFCWGYQLWGMKGVPSPFSFPCIKTHSTSKKSTWRGMVGGGNNLPKINIIPLKFVMMRGVSRAITLGPPSCYKNADTWWYLWTFTFHLYSAKQKHGESSHNALHKGFDLQVRPQPP